MCNVIFCKVIILVFCIFHQRDSNLARMLFSNLYCSLFGLMERELGEEEGGTAVAAIRDGLNAVLTHSTDYHPPFIGSLHVSGTMWEVK